MCSNDRDGFLDAVDALGEAMARCVKLRPQGVLTGRDCLTVLANLEVLARRLPALQHDLLNATGAQCGPVELGGTLAHALADRLLISRAEARRRLGEAAELGERSSVTGVRLAPLLEATAQAQRAGRLGREQVGLIRGFFHELPGWVDAPTREQAQGTLVELGGQFRPEQLKRAAAVLATVINPDGSYTDEDRARRCGVWIGPQHRDGMSPIRGWLSPELRAGLDAVFAKWAAPGSCNPADQTATVDADPIPAHAEHDLRTSAQRHHDALNAVVRAILAGGQLGSHHGLPVSIIVTARLEDLHAKAGIALTGGGSMLPISDVIRLARHAQHYLLIFDNKARPLWLGERKCLASKDQRIVLRRPPRTGRGATPICVFVGPRSRGLRAADRGSRTRRRRHCGHCAVSPGLADVGRLHGRTHPVRYGAGRVVGKPGR
jgi:hypothetical protein